MPVFTHTETVGVPMSFMWHTLMESLAYPERLCGDIHDIKVLKNEPYHVLRQYLLHGMYIREMVTWDEAGGTVKCALVNNDAMEGNTFIHVTTISPSSCRLNIRVEWNARLEHSVPPFQETVNCMVRNAKSLAESKFAESGMAGAPGAEAAAAVGAKPAAIPGMHASMQPSAAV